MTESKADVLKRIENLKQALKGHWNNSADIEWIEKYVTEVPEQVTPEQGAEEGAETYAKGLIGEYDPEYQEEYDAICSHFLSGVEHEKRKQQQPAPAQGVEEAIYPNEYVCGFLFDKDIRQVVLIWKEKPAWQKDKLNGVGGKIEQGETPYQAMVREFKEETGLTVENWKQLASVSEDHYRVRFFYAVDEKNQFEYAETKESEEVAKLDLDEHLFSNYPHISNLEWLIDLAINLANSPEERIVAGNVSETPHRLQQEQGIEETFRNDPVNFILSSAMRSLTEEQKIALRDALIERTPKNESTCCARWVNGIPVIIGPCLFVSKSNFGDYSIWEAKYIDGMDGGYLALCNGEGEEWGDIAEFTCEQYCILTTNTFPTREQAEQFSAQLEDDCGFSYKHKEVIGACAIAMYDWIIEQINKTKP